MKIPPFHELQFIFLAHHITVLDCGIIFEISCFQWRKTVVFVYTEYTLKGEGLFFLEKEFFVLKRIPRVNKEFLFLFNTNIAQGFIITLASGLFAAEKFRCYDMFIFEHEYNLK